MRSSDTPERSVRARDGFTMIEIVMAMGLVAFLLTAIMAIVGQSFVLSSSNHDSATAIKEAQVVMNDVRVAVRAAVVFPDDVLAAFPPGVLSPPRTTLPGEIVTISYEDVSASPLLITVRIQFTDDRGHLFTKSLTTALTNF